MRRLSDIRLRRGMLLERITTQRYFLAAEIQPAHAALDHIDSVRTRVRTGIDYIKRHRLFFGLTVATLAILNGRRTFRLVRRGFFAWKTWQTLRQRFTYF